MDLDEAGLIAEAEAAAENAHAPYSGFAVGAVAVAADGAHFPAANVENAAFASSLCAEAVAVASAVAAGRSQIDTVAVASAAGGRCYPCGNCRQIMSEFGVERLVVRSADGGIRVFQLADLLPRAFGPELSPQR
jgi:cytidine deaminase